MTSELQISNRKSGERGEDMALEFLKGKGYILAERNWRHGKCEIDLIMEENNTIVFVEVKLRSTDAFGWPEEAVKKAKQKNLIKAAEEYLFQRQANMEPRFDIISIVMRGEKPEIFHIVDAFMA